MVVVLKKLDEQSKMSEDRDFVARELQKGRERL